MTGKKVSVIIPSYNHSKYLKRAIDSVLEQTYKDFELIILDDCSTDNSSKIINSYNDKRIKRYFNKENNGAVDTLNQLIDLATGEYIALLNSDDFWSLDKLEKQLTYLESNFSIAACFTWADFIDENDKTIYDANKVPLDLFQKKNRTQAEWLRFFFDNGNCLCHPSVMIRSEVYSQIGKYKNIFRQLPDFEFWIRLIKEYNIHIIEENLTHFRILSGKNKNSSYLSEQNKNIMNYEIYMIKKEFFTDCKSSLFFDAFQDIILNEDCLMDSNMIQFEKSMVMYNSRYYKQLGRFISYSMLGELLVNPSVANMIFRKYKFSMIDYYNLGKEITELDVQYSDYNVIEKIPDYILQSRFYRISNKIYNSKVYATTLKIRMAYRKLRGK